MPDRDSGAARNPRPPEPRPPTADELNDRFGRVPKNWWELIPAFAGELVATDGTDPSGEWPDTFFLYRHRLVPTLYGIAPESRLQGAMDMDFTSDQKVSEGYYNRMGETGRAAWEDVQPMVAAGHDVVTWGSARQTLDELRALRDVSDKVSIHAGPRLLAQLGREERSGPVAYFRTLLDRFIVDAMLGLQEATSETVLEEDDVLWGLGHDDRSIRQRAMLGLGELEIPTDREGSGAGDEGS